MADYDPPNTGDWDGEVGYDGAQGDQEILQDSTEQDQHQANYTRDQSVNVPGDSPVADDADDDAGEYDPASVTEVQPTAAPAHAQGSLKPSPQPATKKQRSLGGFLVVDSDSEEEEPATSVHGSASQANLRTSIPPSPLQTSVSNDAIGHQAAEAPVRQDTSSTQHAGSTRGVGKSNGVGINYSSNPGTTTPFYRPQDKVQTLEERIRDDPRGAVNEWLALIAEHRVRHDMESARHVHERFLNIFPQGADVWISYLELELEAGNFSEAEAIFARCLMEVPHVGVWTKYLDYIRRRNPINEGASQRQTVGESFKFVIDNIGLDKDSGKIWADYIHFLKAAPGKVGGSDWQDQQKMDQLRKAYHQATSVPIENINTLWKEYDQFEMNLNKITGRKFLSDRSPSYMSAKSAVTALKNITQGLHRTNIPRLPPAPGFEGDQEFAEQVEIWKRWIAWEKTDPLEIKDEQPDAYQKRVKYVYNQALMALRFWPEMWADAAQWCLDENIMDKDKNQPAALDYLDRGIQANPESVLLALKHGDYIESTHPVQDTEEGKIERGQAVRQPFQRVLETLYASIKTVKDREAAMIAKIEEAAAAELGALPEKETEEDDEYNAAYEQEDREKLKKVQIDAVQKGNNAQIQLLSRTISFVWIALMRAMRRIQGKGDPKSPLGGMRAIFQEARQKGRLTSEVYVASALMEWTIYKDKVGGKIFERGAKLFPEDDNYNLEYIKYLHSTDDFTNARVLFETFVNRLTQDPKKVHQTKTLYAYFHKWESQYGEHAQVMKLEQRMAELFPEDPKLTLFNKRFATDKFDPIAARIIISPTTQLRPKSSVVPSIEPITSRPISPAPLPYVPSPHPGLLQVAQSPKRPFPVEDFEDANPPRKMMRGEESQRGVSPLKGAAGRRLDQQRRMQGHGPGSSYTAAPRPISRDITFLLNIIPSPDLYRGPHFDRHMVVYTLQTTRVPNEGFSTAMRGAHAPSHARHVSNDVGGRRNSPMPGYRQSPQRPGSSGSYEPPPPAGMAQLAQQAAMGYPAVGQFDQGAWQQQLGSTPMYATPGQAQGNAASRQPYQGYQQY